MDTMLLKRGAIKRYGRLLSSNTAPELWHSWDSGEIWYCTISGQVADLMYPCSTIYEAVLDTQHDLHSTICEDEHRMDKSWMIG